MLRVHRVYPELRVRLRVRVYRHMRGMLQLYGVYRVYRVFLRVYRV